MALYVDDATPYDGERERELLAAIRDDSELYEKIFTKIEELRHLIDDLCDEFDENEDLSKAAWDLYLAAGNADGKHRARQDELTGERDDL